MSQVPLHASSHGCSDIAAPAVARPYWLVFVARACVGLALCVCVISFLTPWSLAHPFFAAFGAISDWVGLSTRGRGSITPTVVLPLVPLIACAFLMLTEKFSAGSSGVLGTVRWLARISAAVFFAKAGYFVWLLWYQSHATGGLDPSVPAKNFFMDAWFVPAQFYEGGKVRSPSIIAHVAFGLVAVAFAVHASPHARGWRLRFPVLAIALAVTLALVSGVGLARAAGEVIRFSPTQSISVGSLLVLLLLAGAFGLNQLHRMMGTGVLSARSVLNPVVAALCVLVIGLATTHELVGREQAARDAATTQEFGRMSDRVVAETRRRAELPLYMLASIRGLYLASKSVERMEFNVYVNSRDIAAKFPGCIGFGVIKSVKSTDLDAFIAMQRADFAPEFALHQGHANNTRDVPTHDDVVADQAADQVADRVADQVADHWVVTFAAPEATNRAVQGFDAGTDPVRREAIERAVRSGQSVLTTRVMLQQDPEGEPGCLYLLPIYHIGMDTSSEAARIAAIDCVAYCPVKLHSLFGAITDTVEAPIGFRVSEMMLAPLGTDHSWQSSAIVPDGLLYQNGLWPPNNVGGDRVAAVRLASSGGSAQAEAGESQQRSAAPSTDPAQRNPTLFSDPIELGATRWVIETSLPAEKLHSLSRVEPAEVIGVLLTMLTAVAVAAALATHARNRALAVLSDELRETTERAHRVVDDVSHEFRTPLTVIKEFSAIIREGVAGAVSASQAEYLALIDAAATDLNHLVEDLLDSSKLRVGRLRVSRVGGRIEEMFARVNTDFARRVSARAITLEIRVAPDLPAVFADEEKVRRVISNLMSNAVKFSPEGGVVQLSATKSAIAGEVVVTVTDQGRGLSAADIEGLFRRFQQRTTPKDRSAKGFGLGLVIAEELARLNLGKLSVKSEVGHGASFSFTLPIADEQSVLAHFFESVQRNSATQPPALLALLAVHGEDSAGRRIAAERATGALGGAPSVCEPRTFLTALTHPSDLVLDAAWLCDHSHAAEDELAHDFTRERAEIRAAPRRWFLLGRTESADGWVERLTKARAAQEVGQSAPLEPLRIEVVHTWRYPREAHLAQVEVPLLLESLSESSSLVETHSHH